MKWRPVDYLALLILAAITFALIVFMLRPFITGTPNPEQTTQAATELLGALIAIVAIYIGTNLKDNKNDNDTKGNKL